MRVIVTGGAGLIGSHLCAPLLDRGDSVLCVDGPSTGDPPDVRRLPASTGSTSVLQDVSG